MMVRPHRPHSVRLLAIGDWGRGGSPEQRAVAEAMAAEAEQVRPAAILSTGDNFYENGVASTDDPQFETSFEQVYRHPALTRVPWFPVLGNHDHRGSAAAQVAYGGRSRRWQMGGRRYVRRLTVGQGASVRLVFLDTTPLVDLYGPDGSEPTPGVWSIDREAEWAWIRHALAPSDDAWTIVVGHHPVFSGSPFHGSAPEFASRLRPLLERAGADLYVCGHEHDLQHLEVGGVHYVVSGAGSECRETGALPHTRFCTGAPGFAVLDVTADALTVRFRSADGDELHTVDARRQPARSAA